MHKIAVTCINFSFLSIGVFGVGYNGENQISGNQGPTSSLIDGVSFWGLISKASRAWAKIYMTQSRLLKTYPSVEVQYVRCKAPERAVV